MPINPQLNTALTACVHLLFADVEKKFSSDERPITIEEFNLVLTNDFVTDVIAMQIKEKRDPDFWESMLDESNFNGE